MPRIKGLLLCVAMAIVSPAHAQEIEALPVINVPPDPSQSSITNHMAANHSMVFRRDAITIRPPESFVILNADTPKAEPEPIKPQPVKIQADIRGEDVIRLDSINNLSRLKEDAGLLIMLDYPLDMPLIPNSFRKPLDILFINENGIIIQIAPRLVLADLKQEMFVGKPIKAFLYLVGGTCEAKSIAPGHWVDHPLFAKKPIILK